MEQVGATIVPELSGATDLVIGIKEAPITEVEKLLSKSPGRKRSWMMFSHTHKGQVSIMYHSRVTRSNQVGIQYTAPFEIP